MMSTRVPLLRYWRFLVGVVAGLAAVGQAQVATNVLNDGTTVAGLVRLENLNETGGAEMLLFSDADAGGLIAEQTEDFTGFPLHAAWYVSSIQVTKPVYSVSVSAKPAGEYPETRIGVMGWLDLGANRGIVLRARPNPGDNRFEVSVVNFGATTEAENDSQTGLFNLDGTPADPFLGSAQAEAGNYVPDAFAVFQLEFSAPTASDLAVLAAATSRVTGRVFQSNGGGPLAQVGGTIELLTTLPVPAQHQVGYYANWNSNLVPGSTVGTVRLLTIVGEILQVNQKPVVALTSPLPGATSREPGSFELAATASDLDGTVLKVDFLKGAEVVATVTTPPYQFTVSGLPAGEYQFAARATDNGGATASSGAVTVTVTPNQPPTVAITSPLDGAQYVAPASFDLVASANDADGTVASVEFFRGETSLGVDTQAPYVTPVSGLPAGSYEFSAVARDNLGATSAVVRISIEVIGAQVPPSLSAPRPLPSAENFQQLAFTITGTTGAEVVVEKTSDFMTWTLVETFTLPASSVERVYPHQPGAGLVAYRVRSSGGGGPVTPPELGDAAALPSLENFQQFRFTAEGFSGRRYRVESSVNLQTWTEVETGTAAVDAMTFTYAKSSTSTFLFYRVVLLP